MKRTMLAAAASLTLLFTAGCGDDDTASTDETTTTAAAAADAITVSGQWARTSPAMADAGAAYMTITAADDDALVGASVSADVAGKVEIHETKMVEGGDMSSTTMAMGGDESTTTAMSGDMATTTEAMSGDMTTTTAAGMGEMTMVPVDKIDLPAGKAVELKPGGYHIMLLELPKPLENGTTIEITLHFENADDLVVTVPVQDEAP